MCLWCCEQRWVWKMLILQAFYLLAVSCLKVLNLLKIYKKMVGEILPILKSIEP